MCTVVGFGNGTASVKSETDIGVAGTLCSYLLLNGTDLEEVCRGEVDIVVVGDEGCDVWGGGDGGMSEGEEGEEGSDEEELDREIHGVWG